MQAVMPRQELCKPLLGILCQATSGSHASVDLWVSAVPVRQAETQEQKLRYTVLEILTRLPPNDVLRAVLPDLVRLAMATLQTDNECNGMISLRIFFDLLKNFRPAPNSPRGLEEHVPPFLEFVQKVWGRLIA
jgi:transformation/transcription domain-associated protein